MQKAGGFETARLQTRRTLSEVLKPAYSFFRTARAISGSLGKIAEYFSHNR